MIDPTNTTENSGEEPMSRPGAQVPAPPSERGVWVLAISLAALGATVLVATLSGVIGSTSSGATALTPPPVALAAVTPAPGPAQSASVLAGAGALGRASVAIVARPSRAE